MHQLRSPGRGMIRERESMGATGYQRGPCDQSYNLFPSFNTRGLGMLGGGVGTWGSRMHPCSGIQIPDIVD